MATLTATPDFQSFLEEHLDRDLLRFTTAGSVDDGKSTLIGRLLHDTKSVYEDQLLSVQNSKVNRAGGNKIDLSLLTDGLRAEREQGITIDVAYRYFSTAKRKFIIADTPGHEQYTRNMATGASTADVAIVLIDGSKGILPQSRRHSFIVSLLNIPQVIAAVNKMDLVGYSEDRYRTLEEEYRALAASLGLESVTLIPVSALEGDNVVNHGSNMPWYTGPTLLHYLETVPLHEQDNSLALRFPVQLVQRPDRTFRGFSGTIASGTVHTGRRVMALPSGKESTIQRIATYDGDLQTAIAGQSVTLELADEIDLSRGDMLVALHAPPRTATRFRAKVVWMHEQPLRSGASFLLKHTTRTVRATASAIAYRVDVSTFDHRPAESLTLNEIAEVHFTTALPIFFDSYRANRITGAFILIDPVTNATVGAGMIDDVLEEATEESASTHRLAYLPEEPTAAQQLVEALRNAGRSAVLLDDEYISDVASAVRGANLCGALAVISRVLGAEELARVRSFASVHTLDGAIPAQRLAAQFLEDETI